MLSLQDYDEEDDGDDAELPDITPEMEDDISAALNSPSTVTLVSAFREGDSIYDVHSVLGRTVTWKRGFLEFPLACLGSKTAAVQLWNSQKIVYKASSPSNSTTWYLQSLSGNLSQNRYYLAFAVQL